MANRLISDAKDLKTGELIYFRGHAKATYMSNGATVEDAINSISSSGGGSGSGANMTNYYTKAQIDAKGYLTSIPSEYVTDSELDNKGYLTSHQDIKTINGTSLIGSGNVTIGYKPLQTSTSTTMTLSPNIYYRNTNTSLARLTINLGSESDSSILNEYLVEFTTRSSGTTVSLPSSVKWANGETPTFEASTTYQISIVNNLGIVTKFK